jgi:hypothetical protein
MPGTTLVLVDAGMVAGFRRSAPSLLQLHQAVVHLYRQHPDVRVVVLADPSLKWDLSSAEQTLFEGDIIARAVVCAPAGAVEGTRGFLSRTAAKASEHDQQVVAVTDRALPGVSLGRLRNDGGRWLWDIDDTRIVDEADAAAAVRSSRSAKSSAASRRRRRT